MKPSLQSNTFRFTRQRSTQLIPLIIIAVCILLLTVACQLGNAVQDIANQDAIEETGTPIPTLAETATAVPPTVPPPSPTPRSIDLSGNSFDAGKDKKCNTNVNIKDIEDGSLVVAEGGIIHITTVDGELQMQIFCYGAQHTWLGTLTYKDHIINSNPDDPLRFEVSQTGDYKYLGGKGSVTFPDGSKNEFGTAVAEAATYRSPGETQWQTVHTWNFNKDNENWFTGEEMLDKVESSVTARDGKYIWEVTSKNNFLNKLALAPVDEVEDFEFSIEGFQVSGTKDTSFSIAARWNEQDTNYYTFHINQNIGIYSVHKYYDGKWETLLDWTKSPAINIGGTNRLTVRSIGSEYTMIINGEEMSVKINDDQIKNGSVGIGIDLFAEGDNAQYEFDNIELKVPVN